MKPPNLSAYQRKHGCDAATAIRALRTHPLDTRPPDGKYPECSADVTLVYADGREVPGYWCDWIGWMRTDGWVPCECDYDDVMPVGWKEVQSCDTKS